MIPYTKMLVLTTDDLLSCGYGNAMTDLHSHAISDTV